MLMGGIFAGLCTLPEASKTYQDLVVARRIAEGTVSAGGHCKCRKAELNVLQYVLVEDYVVTKHASI